MAVMRNKTQRQYVNVAYGILKDPHLSLKDRGLLITLLSLPDGWKYSVKGLVAILSEDGKHAIATGIKHLEELGYLVRTQTKGENGKFGGYDWEVYDTPQKGSPLPDFPTTENPTTENPMTGNQSQSIIHKSIMKESIMDQSSDDEHYINKWNLVDLEKQIPVEITHTVFHHMMKRVDKEKITEAQFADICNRINDYGKPVSDLQAFAGKCIENYFSDERKPDKHSKKNSFCNYQQNDYDFEMLERELVSNL